VVGNWYSKCGFGRRSGDDRGRRGAFPEDPNSLLGKGQAKASQVCPPARWQRTSKELVRHCSATLDAQNIVGRHFKPLLKRAGLPDIRWHDLRHTYATLLLARGTHPTYVQKSLGHASVQLTLDRYSHWMPSMGRNTAEGIDEALG
jgi:integrase